MSSSLRNAVKRITHKERSQPQARAHLGFLEKKQDYKRRADHYHRKEDRLQSIKRKASMRNPDEFYFKMHNSIIKEGKHQQTDQARSKELAHQIGPDAVKVMKSQDLAHVRMMKQRETKKAAKLKEALHLIQNNNKQQQSSKHTIFVQSKEQANNFDPAKHFDTEPELVHRAFNRPRTSTLKASVLGYDDSNNDDEAAEDTTTPLMTQEDLIWQSKQAKNTAKKAAKARSNAYGELEARVQRAAAMERAEAHLVTEKMVAGKGRKRKIKAAENGQPAQYKWRRKRKK